MKSSRIGHNIKLLRRRRGLSQEEMALALGFTRSSYSGYENGLAQPSIEGLIVLSDYHHISVDELIKSDFSLFTEAQWERIDRGEYADAQGRRLRVLATLVNDKDEELIELIPQKASAGYTNGYSDPDYLKILPTFTLPFLSKNKKYRSFPITGDSMPPVMDGSYVIAEFVQNWTTIKDETPCIVITKHDGIVFKIVNNRLETQQAFQLCSINTFYEPYMVSVQDVVEIWKFVNYISPELPLMQVDTTEVSRSLMSLQQEIHELKNTIFPKRLRQASDKGHDK